MVYPANRVILGCIVINGFLSATYSTKLYNNEPAIHRTDTDEHPLEGLDASVKNPEWKFFQGHHYAFLEDLRWSWNDARILCNSFTNESGTSSLATVSNVEVENFMYDNMVDEGAYYIGLKVRGNKINCTEDSCYYWQTGDRVNYTNWSSSQPDNDRELEFCCELWNSYSYSDASRWGFNDFLCDSAESERYIICEWRQNETPCPSSSWKGKGKSCYWIDSSTSYSANEAANICGSYKHMGRAASLASVKGGTDTDFFLAHTEYAGIGFWTGGRALDNCTTLPRRCFYWTNGDAFTYINWEDEQPNNSTVHGGEGCIEYGSNNSGQWNDLNCTWSYNPMGYICEWKGE